MERADPRAGRDAWATDGFAPVPGDVVLLPGDARGTVEAVYLCAESSVEDGRDQVTRWSWIVLSDGRLLEVAPRGSALYDPPAVLRRGSGPFLDLVAQDGALVRFEERVRAGSWEARPVRLTFGRRRWRATSTGTVTAHRLGKRPSSGWEQVGDATDAGFTAHAPSGREGTGSHADTFETAWVTGGAGDGRPVSHNREPDVYFTLAALDDPDALGLGVWATDICLAFGCRLGDTPLAAGLRIVESERVTDLHDAG